MTDGPRLAVFGASGATGTLLVRHAAATGVRVRAFVRAAGPLLPDPPAVEVLVGALDDPAAVRRALEGCDAACCVFGPRPLSADIFCERATATIVAAMRAVGAGRLVCLTGGMVGEWPDNRTLPFAAMTSLFARRRPGTARDRDGQERAVMESGLDWTVVKPPLLTDVRAKGRWNAGPDVRLGLLSSIPRADLAAFLLKEALEPEFSGEAVFIKSGAGRRVPLTGIPLRVRPPASAPLGAALTWHAAGRGRAAGARRPCRVSGS